MTAQTAYTIVHAIGFEGGLDSQIGKSLITGRNNTATPIPVGRFVAFDTGAGTSEIAVKVLSAAANKLRGVVVLDQAHEPQSPDGYAEDELVSILEQGNVLMITEQAVTPNDTVHTRFNATGATGTTPAVGRVRKDPDGVAEVNTCTPTAANAQLYSLSFLIDGVRFTFSYLSDASGTATEICDAFRTAMAADAAFTAEVVATGTVTLILTSQRVGVSQGITNVGPGVMGIVATTPAAATAVKVAGARFKSSAAAGGLVWVSVNLPA